VARVDPATNEIFLTDGHTLPVDFKAWTYGHALTAYRAQGSTAEESILVLGEVAEQALMRRQFYVANTRYRGAHRIYVSHEAAIFERLAAPDPGRELATEFMERNGLSLAERLVPQPMRRMRATLRRAWLGMVEQFERARETQQQRMRM
jgi:hypothetical protein